MPGGSGTAVRPATPSGDPIMAAKFQVPPDRFAVVKRGRLLDRLSDGVRGPLTLISAPAGSGKTLLAGSWVTAGVAPGPVTWITLDEGDDQPGVFWSYVLEGLARSGVPVAPVGVPDRDDSTSQSLLIRLAACLSERPGPVVLILDNGEVLGQDTVPNEIDFVIRHAAPRLRVVIITRVDPQLPLHRYRLAGTMTEIRLDELSFTVPETRALLAEHHVHLSDSATVALTDHSKGWAASLRLAGMALQHAIDAEEMVRSCTCDRSEIAEYFRAEVLDAQSPATRSFLLRTSVVDRLWPGLAIELSGRRDAAHTLATLVQANTFVELSPESDGSHRYHPLVHDLLRAQLARESPAKLRQLHRKAAHWLAGADRLTDAACHAASAGDWEEAAALLVQDQAIGLLLLGMESRRITEALATMPDDVPGPEAAVVQAALATARNDTERGAKHLLRATELVDVGSPRQATALALAIAATRAVLASAGVEADGGTAAVEAAQAILAQLRAAGIQPPRELTALILGCKGTLLLHAGDLEAAAAALAAGAQAADAPGCEQLRADVLGQLGLVQALQGRLRRAALSAQRVAAHADRSALAAARRPVAMDVALAWVHTEQSDLAAARRYADRAAAAPGFGRDAVSSAVLAIVRGRLLRARGELAGAAVTIEEARTSAGPVPLPRWLGRRLETAQAALHLAGGRPDLAVRALRDAEAPELPDAALVLGWARFADGATAGVSETAAEILEQASAPLEVRVEASLLAASCELEKGRPDLARAALWRALRLAEPERLRRPFLEAAPQLRQFLRQNSRLMDSQAWLVTGTPGARPASRPAPSAAVVIAQPLSDREQEVLRHLAALLSTEEIAGEMFVSVNTVKTHVRAVLRKLSATRRNEAIRHARELGLL